MKDRKCMGFKCEARLPFGQLYCLQHRPKHHQMEGPDGRLTTWENHPAYAESMKRIVSSVPPAGVTSAA